MVKIFAAFLATLLAGCTLIQKESSPVALYDLGPIPMSAAGAVLSSQTMIQVANISAPAWLDTQAIRYRLAYHDPARIYTYAGSRWNAPPAELLTERFRQYFATRNININSQNKEHAPTGYLLKIDLGEFTQIFNAPDSSEVVVQLHATLYEPTSRLPVAQQNFSGRQAAQTADAAGAVTAFILVSDSLLDELVQWLSDIHQ